MNRRAFLSLLASAAVDSERLVCQPGKRLISIPSLPLIGQEIELQINGSISRWIVNAIDTPPLGRDVR